MQDKSEEQLLQKHLANINILARRGIVAMNEFQTTASFLKVRSISEIHKPVQNPKPQADITQQELIIFEEKEQEGESMTDLSLSMQVKGADCTFGGRMKQSGKKLSDFNVDVQSVMISTQDDVLSRDSRMINIDDQAKFNISSKSPQQSSGIMHSSQKTSNRILTHMEKCMRSMVTTTKFNAE